MFEYCWDCTYGGYRFVGMELGSTIHEELSSLCLEGKAKKEADGSFLIPHEKAVLFDRDERDLLTLPDVFPYRISIVKRMAFNVSTFRLEIHFLRPDEVNFVNPQVMGSLIKISNDQIYMFNWDQYKLVQTAEECGAHMGDYTDKQARMNYTMRQSAELQKYAGNDRIELPTEISELVAPDGLSVDFIENEDGSYSARPVLLKQEGDQVRVLSSASFDEEFKKAYRIDPHKAFYKGGDGKQYVFTPEQGEGLQEVKKRKNLTRQDVERIRMNPKSEFVSDVFNFHLGDYGERVEGYGVYVKPRLPYLERESESWLPEEGKVAAGELGNSEGPVLTSSNVWDIHAAVQEAKEKGQKDFVYEYKIYPLSSSFEDKLQQFIDELEDNPGVSPSNGTGNGNPTAVSGPQSILIKDNLGTLQYTAEKRKRGCPISGEAALFSGLKPKIRLKPYQKDGIQWMWKNWQEGWKGVLLADDMGLGKTVQTLGFLSSLKKGHEDDMASILIVAPASLLTNWKEECEKFVQDGIFEQITELYGDNARPYRAKKKDKEQTKVYDLTDEAVARFSKNKIILTTYETLQKYQIGFGRISWSVMVLDEAQKIKNPVTLNACAVKAMNYDFAIALTGTPVENSWQDLWSIMDFVVAGKLMSLRDFNVDFQSQVKELSQDPEKLQAVGRKLEQALQPVFLRRQKEDHLKDLPEIASDSIREAMPESQRKAYESVIADARSLSAQKKRGQALGILARLRDVSLCPYLVYRDEELMKLPAETLFTSSARLKVTWQQLFKIKQWNEKVLLFVISKKLQKALIKCLREKFGYSAVCGPLNGETDIARRQDIIDDFNARSSFSILILSPEAAGVGLNITGANHVIHLSRCWNPAKEDQATSRVYRIGQKKKVHVYIPLAIDKELGEGASFDEKLDQLLTRKRGLSRSVIFPTGDSAQDGIQMFNGIVDDISGDKPLETVYWSMDDIDRVNGDQFEEIVQQLYNAIPNYKAFKTPHSGDYGVDVVVYTNPDKTEGLLIQCKQTSSGKNMNSKGVQEIASALPYYQREWNCNFRGILITNAPEFTGSAKKLAETNRIQLIARNELESLLRKYPVIRR